MGKANVADTVTLWNNRNNIAATKQLFKTALSGDLIHLQSFDDSHVSMQRSLAAQLERVGKFKWSHSGGRYATDMGDGGAQQAVGTTSQLWLGTATPSAAMVAEWRNRVEKQAWDKLDSAERDRRNTVAANAAHLPRGLPQSNPGLPVLAAANLTEAVLKEARAAIRQEMETAEANRDQWKPL